MPNDNSRKCDECSIKLNGACYVDGPLLLCADCAENLDYEREMDEAMDQDETDGDIFEDHLDMYMREY